jgi:hypothetical protein
MRISQERVLRILILNILAFTLLTRSRDSSYQNVVIIVSNVNSDRH